MWQVLLVSKFFPNHPYNKITSPFGMRTHPVTKVKQMHNGIDLVASNGTDSQTDYITNHTTGIVESVGYNQSAGYYVKIRVSSRTLMVYYHLSGMPYVKKGNFVKQGEKLGFMGSTGTATGAHLHWGIKRDGKWIDPEPFLENYSEGEGKVNIELSVLKYGSKGNQVRTLQKLLGISNDGSFGPATESAVKAYQKAQGLSVDGSVGTKTWTKLLKG
jgi:hypothetical protein